MLTMSMARCMTMWSLVVLFTLLPYQHVNMWNTLSCQHVDPVQSINILMLSTLLTVTNDLVDLAHLINAVYVFLYLLSTHNLLEPVEWWSSTLPTILPLWTVEILSLSTLLTLCRFCQCYILDHSCQPCLHDRHCCYRLVDHDVSFRLFIPSFMSTLSTRSSFRSWRRFYLVWHIKILNSSSSLILPCWHFSVFSLLTFLTCALNTLDTFGKVNQGIAKPSPNYSVLQTRADPIFIWSLYFPNQGLVEPTLEL